MKPVVRIATNADAENIRLILDENRMIPRGLDWTEVEPSWIVAEFNGVIVGCAQFLIGKPLGHIGFIAVLPGYQNNRHGFGCLLALAAESILSNSGCDGYTGMTSNPIVKRRFLRTNGIVFGDPVEALFKRVQKKSKGNHYEQREIENHSR